MTSFLRCIGFLEVPSIIVSRMTPPVRKSVLQCIPERRLTVRRPCYRGRDSLMADLEAVTPVSVCAKLSRSGPWPAELIERRGSTTASSLSPARLISLD